MLIIAYIVLFGWPIVSIILFKKLPIDKALVWSMLLGILVMPSKIAFDYPVIPEINRDLVPSVCALVILLFMDRSDRISGGTELKGWVPGSLIGRTLFFSLVLCSFPTFLTNTNALFYGPRFLPGLRLYDAFSISLEILVQILPFLLGRKFLAHPDTHRSIIFALFIAALWYSLPTLYEARMSPQFNRTIFGYFPHEWKQHIRAGGFRPLVLTGHGLMLGLVFCLAIVSTAVLVRVGDVSKRVVYLAALGWLLVTLVIAKSLGALMIAVLLVPIVLFGSLRIHMIFAAAIAATVLTYPALRGSGFVPTPQVVAFAERINTNRAASLEFRLGHEDILLEKANQKPLFGWGGWGRARAFDDRGRNTSVLDGRWVITLGAGGWLRYIGEFGLLCAGIILLWWRQRAYEITMVTSGLCLILAANLIDSIPNAGLTPLTWLIAGALFGRFELGKLEPERVEADSKELPRSRFSRTRFGDRLAPGKTVTTKQARDLHFIP